MVVKGIRLKGIYYWLLNCFLASSCTLFATKRLIYLAVLLGKKKERILGGKIQIQKFDFDFNYFFVITDVFSKMYNVMIRHSCCFWLMLNMNPLKRWGIFYLEPMCFIQFEYILYWHHKSFCLRDDCFGYAFACFTSSFSFLVNRLKVLIHTVGNWSKLKRAFTRRMVNYWNIQ